MDKTLFLLVSFYEPSRHPSNLMLDRLSGKIIHIDFGDCFEVAMVREKYPEKIPFRLTRMLINAMEVSPVTLMPYDLPDGDVFTEREPQINS